MAPNPIILYVTILTTLCIVGLGMYIRWQWCHFFVPALSLFTIWVKHRDFDVAF